MHNLKSDLIGFDLNSQEVSLQILFCVKDRLDFILDNVQMADLKELPKLPYSDQSFDLALSSQILFVDDAKYDENFQRDLLMELCRVAGEVRVFPVINQNGQPSRYLGPILKMLQDKALGTELRQMNSGPKSGEALLRIWHPTC